jgi:hypothetical protein
MPNGLKIPPIPKKVGEYRSKMWVEVHLLRWDVEQLKKDRVRLETLEKEVDKAKTWTRATAYFSGLILSGLLALAKKVGTM